MNSPYRTISAILDDIHRNISANPEIRDSAAYKREALRQLQRQSVIPVDSIHNYLQVLLNRYPQGGSRVAEYGASGPNKSQIPASQRKERGGGDWRMTTRDLDREYTNSPTSSAGLRRRKRELGMTGRDTRDVVTEVDEVGPQTQGGSRPISPARDVEKTPAPDFSWVSNFDITEIKQAVDKIVDHISTNTDDSEQVHLLRNDIRILDNLATALKSGNGEKIEATWKIACSADACEHLHDEFIGRMNDTLKQGGNRVAESFGDFLNAGKKNSSDVVFEEYGAWVRACITRGYVVKECAGSSIVDAHTETGDLVGAFCGKCGWVFESVEEAAPPGEEEWIKKNKASFVDQYGEDKGMSVLYATAWKNYNKKHGKK